MILLPNFIVFHFSITICYTMFIGVLFCGTRHSSKLLRGKYLNFTETKVDHTIEKECPSSGTSESGRYQLSAICQRSLTTCTKEYPRPTKMT